MVRNEESPAEERFRHDGRRKTCLVFRADVRYLSRKKKNFSYKVAVIALAIWNVMYANNVSK